MKGWEQCPRCWGSGLLAFLKPCTQAPTFDDLNLRDLTKEPMTQEEMVAFMQKEPDLLAEILAAPTEKAALETVARMFVRMLVQAVFRV